MNQLDQLATVLDNVERLQLNQLQASCPCPGHEGPLPLVATFGDDGGVRARCRGGCSSWVLQPALQARLEPRFPSLKVVAGTDGLVTIPTDWKPLQRREPGQDSPVPEQDPKEAVRDILRRTGGRTGLRIFESANLLSEAIMKVLVKSGARLVHAGGRGFLLADGTLMGLEPQNPELQSLFLLRFGILVTDPVIKPVLERWNIVARSVGRPVPLRAGAYTDCSSLLFYMPEKDQVLRIGPEGQQDRIRNGEGIVFLRLATDNAPNIPDPLPPLDHLVAFLEAIPYLEGQRAKPFDSWAVVLSWLLAALMQDVVRPVPFLVLGGDPEVAAVLARILGTLVAGPDLHTETWLHEGALSGLVGACPVAVLDLRGERIPKWFAVFMADTRAGYLRPDRFPLDYPVAPIAVTHLILVPRPQDTYTDVLPEHAIVVKVAPGDTGPLRAAGTDRDQLVGALVGFIRELLPVLARHPTGLPVTFDTFVRIVFETLGGAAEHAPELSLFQPEERPVPTKPRELDDLLFRLASWLQADPRNVGRFLTVPELFREVVASGPQFQNKPYCRNAASLAQHLKRLEGDLTTILGFKEQYLRSRRRQVAFTKTGEGNLPSIPKAISSMFSGNSGALSPEVKG